MGWLLDTNAWIHYLKNPSSQIRARLEQLTPPDIFSCSIVRAELLHGARKYGLPERRALRVEQTLAPYVSLPFDDSVGGHYAELRHDLETRGCIIGPHDMLIASICLAHDLTLVSSNMDEFRRVKNLRVEDWLVASAT